MNDYIVVDKKVKIEQELERYKNIIDELDILFKHYYENGFEYDKYTLKKLYEKYSKLKGE
jgi:hypothetical protein